MFAVMGDKTCALDNSKSKSQSLWCGYSASLVTRCSQLGCQLLSSAVWHCSKVLGSLTAKALENTRYKQKVSPRTQKTESQKRMKCVLTQTTPVALKHGALSHQVSETTQVHQPFHVILHFWKGRGDERLKLGSSYQIL